MRMSKEFVVKELLDFYHKYDHAPLYQAATLKIWENNGRQGGYSGAYADAVAIIRAEAQATQ